VAGRRSGPARAWRRMLLGVAFSTAPSLTTSAVAMAVLDRPSAISWRTSRSTGRPNVCSSAGRPAGWRARSWVHPLSGVEGRSRRPATRSTAATEPRPTSAHPVLQKVAQPRLSPGQEARWRSALLDVLGQHQDGQLRVGGVRKLHRRHEALVLMVGGASGTSVTTMSGLCSSNRFPAKATAVAHRGDDVVARRRPGGG